MRYALLATLLASLLVAGGVAGLHAQGVSFPEGLAIGDVTPDAAIVWTRTAGPAEVRVEYATDPGLASVRNAGPVQTGPDADFTARVEVTGLQPGQRYHVRVATGTTRGPAGTFVTPPAPDRDAPLSLVWGADTLEGYKPFRIFQAMRGRNTDVFLYLGDTIYSDFGAVRATTLDQYRQKYRDNRDDQHLKAYLATVASWVVWDDHEVANNFAGNHPRLATGLRAFLEYWPIRILPEQPRRLYRSFRWGRTVEVFILDTRQYRSPARLRDGPEKTMLGRTQKQWLLDGLRRSTASVKIVASSVPLRYHTTDSWEGYASEREEILRFIREQRIQNVVVLVADVHYAALLRHPEGPYEAIAGPLAAFAAGVPRVLEKPGALWANAGRLNYGWLRVVGEQIVLGWYDDRNAVLFETRIPIER